MTNAAKEVWSDDKIKDLHAHIANAILKTKHLTILEIQSVFFHGMAGKNKEAFCTVIGLLMFAPENKWEKLSQEFSWLIGIKTDYIKSLFSDDVSANISFRTLQYRIAVKEEPEFAPKLLELLEQETRPSEVHESYLMERLILATQVLKYHQVALPAQKLIGYLKYIVEIIENNKDVEDKYFNLFEQLEGYKLYFSNFYSYLFSFIYMRDDVNASFLNDMIDALDELDPKTRTLLLADFESYNIDCRVLIESICLHEEKEENPDWTRCLQVYDKVIEKTIEWGYPHIAAASSRGKAIIHDEYLKDHNTAHQVYQDIIFKVGALPVIEEGQAVVYIRHGHYQEALDIYERILPEWYKASERFGVGPLEEYRRAAICAANLDDWKKAACFFEEGTNKTQEIENTERYIGSYADAGFAHFKAGNMLDSIKLLHLALEEFEKLSQDTTNVKYYTLRKRLEHTIKWIKNIWYGSENQSSKLFEPDVGFCSDPETKKEYLDLPYCPIGYSWLHLAQIEYRFGHEMIVFQNALQTTDREEYPILNYWLSFLEAQYEFRNKTFDNLPQRILQLARVFSSMKKHQQKGRGAGEKGSYSISNSDLSDFASVDNIIAIFIAALIVLMRVNRGIQEILTIWRKNSSELPINENINSALELIESILLSDIDNTLTVMYTPDTKVEKLLAASIRIMHNAEASLEDLLFAHTYISSCFINSPWEELVVNDLAVHLSSKWLEKVKFRAKLKTPMLTVPQIEQACKSSETGKKKIGQILLEVHHAVSIKVPLSPEFLHRICSWIESESTQKQEHAIGKNPTAQRLIKAMEKPPHLTDEDIEALNQSIKEGKIPIKFDSPFEPDEH